MGMAAGVRCPLAQESLWLDELHTAWVVAGKWSDIESRAHIGNQSPLYFYVVRGVTSILGTSEVSLRLPSLVAGIALIPLAWWLTWRWTRQATAAFVVAILLAWDPWCVFYAQEARSYALVQAVGLIQVGCFWCLLQGGSRRCRVVVVLATGVMFYLHYTSLIVVAGECIAYVVHALFWRGGRAYPPRHALFDAACCAVLIAPALPHLREIALHRDNWSLVVARPDVVRLFTLLSLGPYVALPLGALVASRILQKVIPAKARSATAVGVLPAALVVTACWFCVPLVLTWLLTVLDVVRLFMVRYLAVVIAAPMVFGGLVIAAVPQAWVRGVSAAVVVLVSLQHGGLVSQLCQRGRLVSYRNQDWRAAVARIRDDTAATKNWPVLVRSGFIEADRLRTAPEDPLLRDYCLAPVNSIYLLNDSARHLIPLPTTGSGRLTPAALRELSDSQGAWAIIYGAVRSRPRIERDLLESLRHIGFDGKIGERETFGNVLVVRITR
jgi:hypothetical protein